MNASEGKLDQETERWLRAIARGSLQAVPVAGGLLSEIVSEFWVAPAERRVLEMLQAFKVELERLKISESALLEVLGKSEGAQVLLRQSISAAAETTGTEARQRLGSLLAKSITLDDVEIATSRTLLRMWSDLDDLEVVMLSYVLAGEAERQRLVVVHPAVVGEAAFLGRTPGEEHDRDAFYRLRLNHLMSIGLIRPHDEKAWTEKRLAYHLDSFWPTKIAESLAWLLGLPTRWNSAE